MKKLIQSSILAFTIASAVVLNGCDIFENFLFNLAISFQINSSGTTSPSGSAFYCLEDSETYNDYKDNLNSIVYIEAHIVTESISDTSIRGDGILRLYAGTNNTGQLLAEHVATDIRPADYISPNAYKVNLTEDQITTINNALAQGVTCFYGEYVVVISSGGTNPPNVILVRIDILYRIDADL